MKLCFVHIRDDYTHPYDETDELTQTARIVDVNDSEMITEVIENYGKLIYFYDCYHEGGYGGGLRPRIYNSTEKIPINELMKQFMKEFEKCYDAPFSISNISIPKSIEEDNVSMYEKLSNDPYIVSMLKEQECDMVVVYTLYTD